MGLIRGTGPSISSLYESGSAIEQMTARMLHEHGVRPGPGEIRSWQASMPVLANDLIEAGLSNVEILVEQKLPLTSRRIDAVLTGVHPQTGKNSYVLVELKQWSEAELFEENPELVRIDAYGNRPVPHPLTQVASYMEYLTDFLPGLNDQEASIASVAYLHNATQFSVDSLFSMPQKNELRMFTGDAKSKFFDFLRQFLDQNVSGARSADEFLNLKEGPSKQLLAVAAAEIQNREQFVLLDEQRVAYELVLHEVKRAQWENNKTAVIVTGGPGTGKSVIALSLLGELAREGKQVLHATGSKSFTTTLRKVGGKGSTRTKNLFKYFNSFMDAEPNSLDVLILDEAHRIRETSENRYTKAEHRTGRPQVDELLAIARVPVFLLDQYQVVRPGELGTVEEIEAYAKSIGINVHRVSLDDQFRCGGSEAYIHWVQRLLSLEEGGPIPWQTDGNYQLARSLSPQNMEHFLRNKNEDGFSARMTAGYCWPWSDPTREGQLVNDVSIGSWSRPWNLKGDRAVGGAPPSPLWATDPSGFGQVGCIYTAQGFEYDWNGVILGPDLVRRGDAWVTQRDKNKDPDFKNTKKVSDQEFHRLVINVYKVLLTRGMIGTLIFSADPETSNFLSRLMPVNLSTTSD